MMMKAFPLAPLRWGSFCFTSSLFGQKKLNITKVNLIILFWCVHCFSHAQGQYLSKDEFLDGVFQETPYQMKSLWLEQVQLEQAEKILGHAFEGFRVRYWTDNNKTAWIIDEIGKERPITIGVVVQNDKIVAVNILAFRESRGWEVRNDFFTRQFHQAFLKDQYKLSAEIDGITGATLSVRAVKKVAALALYFNQQLF